MSGAWKTTLVILGILSALLIVSQLALGLIILSKPDNVLRWINGHKHTGYLTVAVSLLYIVGSLLVIGSLPRRPKP
jgi:hypothetical protein